MPREIAKQYDPAAVESKVYERWLAAHAFAAVPDARERRYVIMMPLPNVTGALHMGHAMDNVMQDLLTRWHRMMGDNTLWMPGTDHAGIATQAVVEKRLHSLEGKTRHDVGREGLVERIWDWKQTCQARIIRQQQAMGCSCDWDRQRFTLDRVCARAVRWTFFDLFRDGLIYRGYRLVNWDCHLQTAVSDDEIEHRTVEGHFWHLRYPVIDPRSGEPEYVVVATTRPETMLGDTAVACHPDPAAALDLAIERTRARLAEAPAKERAGFEAELVALEERRRAVLPRLLQLAAMARDGRQVRLPLLDRAMPLIVDEWAKPELGSGCVKITPGHDPNDYDVWLRHKHEIEAINILDTDGTLNANAGPYAGLDRFVARDRVVADLEKLGLLEAVEDRQVEIGHSDRSNTPIEPFLSKQWFVRMGDVEGGIVCGRGTPREHRAAGLAQAAIDAVGEAYRSPSGRRVGFHPDPVRYGNTYRNWLAEKRDWCISRQLWWGHRIPIWAAAVTGDGVARVRLVVEELLGRDDVVAWVTLPDGAQQRWRAGAAPAIPAHGESEILVCLRDEQTEAALAARLVGAGFAQDPDVLDTWFSSAIWPHSTLGWPDPAAADALQEPGQRPLGAGDGRPDALAYYYPGSCLVTARDIITLWVARMVIAGLYNLGDVPFTDVFIHANILDGKGERMSKSKGNGIDPVDIIERYGADAMRYVLCEMQTGSQDIRLPVQAISPFTGELVDLATAKHGRLKDGRVNQFTYLDPKTGQEFDVLGTMKDLPAAKLVSERFEVGRNFCNKLWNAMRFALLNLEETPFAARRLADLLPEDRWILSRLSRTVGAVEGHLEAYDPSAAIGAARDFFWGELCDWYLEIIKPRMREADSAPLARQVLAHVLDQVLRLLQPFVPFIAEELYGLLVEMAPVRGIDAPLPASGLLATARWPERRPEWEDEALERQFSSRQAIIRAIREVRSRHGVAPSKRLSVRVRAAGEAAADLETARHQISLLAALDAIDVSPDAERTPDAATAVVGDVQVFVLGIVDPVAERKRLAKQRDGLKGKIEGARKKLGNEKFVANAPADVVATERARLADMESELATVEDHLRALPGA